MNGLCIVLEQHARYLGWRHEARELGAGAWQPSTGKAPEGQEMAAEGSMLLQLGCWAAGLLEEDRMLNGSSSWLLQGCSRSAA